MSDITVLKMEVCWLMLLSVPVVPSTENTPRNVAKGRNDILQDQRRTIHVKIVDL